MSPRREQQLPSRFLFFPPPLPLPEARLSLRFIIMFFRLFVRVFLCVACVWFRGRTRLVGDLKSLGGVARAGVVDCDENDENLALCAAHAPSGGQSLHAYPYGRGSKGVPEVGGVRRAFPAAEEGIAGAAPSKHLLGPGADGEAALVAVRKRVLETLPDRCGRMRGLYYARALLYSSWHPLRHV